MDVYKVENNENTMRGVVLAHDALMRSLRQMAALEKKLGVERARQAAVSHQSFTLSGEPTKLQSHSIHV